MSINTDYIEAKNTNNLWNFISIHGYGKFSVTTGERLPEDAFINPGFIKYAEIYRAFLKAQSGDINGLLKHGDGQGYYSAVNGVKLCLEINEILAYYHSTYEIESLHAHSIFNAPTQECAINKMKIDVIPEEWETAFLLLNNESYKDMVKMSLPFKMRKKDHRSYENELIIQHSFIYMNDTLYVMEEVLGQGAQGRVKRTTDSNKKYYAVKIEIIDEDNKGELDAEIAALKIMDMYIGHFERHYNRNNITSGVKRYLLMPFIDGYTIGEYLSLPNLCDSDKLKLCECIIIALKRLHDKRIIFTDMKEDNIIFNPRTIKATFIDFGKAVILPNDVSTMHNPYIKLWYSKGYNKYIAPEMNSNSGEVSFSSDVWLLAFRIFKEIQFNNINLHPLLDMMMEFEPSNRTNLDAALIYINQLQKQQLAEFPNVTIPESVDYSQFRL